MTTYTWNGGTGSGSDPTQWTPTGTPGTNDTAIVTSGTVLAGNNTQLHGNTLYLGGTSGTTPAFVTDGSDIINFMTPTVDFQTVISSAVPGVSAPENSLLVATDRFVNQGTIDANGPVGSTFTIQVTTDGTLPGTFINYSQISVESGNEMVIDIAGTSELMNASAIQVIRGTLVINAATNAIAGGYAPMGGGIVVIAGGGTLETNVGYASTATGSSPHYAFADDTAGNTLKIDNIGSFGGIIVGFGVNDTIDLGTSLSVGTIVYNSSSGILNMENAGGTILASLLLGGNFQTGTIPVTGTTAGSFIFTTGADGNTLLTTSAVNDLYKNSSGVWQNASGWTNGVPGIADVPFVGLNPAGPFLLTTGTSPVQAGGLYLVDHQATLQITSSTTFGPNNITEFGGTLDITPGNTLTAPAIRDFGGSIQVDPGALLDLTGHPVTKGVGANNGTLTVNNSNTSAVRLYNGDMLVNGGTLDAGVGQTSGNGGHVLIGFNGGGTPATMTVQSSGTNAAVVTDTYTELNSDPTSFGILTLTGAASWTDEIDPFDTVTTRGFMLIGDNSQVGNTPPGVQPAPFSSAATLQVMNGATLTEESYAKIAATPDSAGSVLIGTGAVWNVGLLKGGFIDVGECAQGNLTIDGGTVAVGNVGTFLNNGTSFTAGGIGIGISAGASGTMVVENGGQFSSLNGMAIGRGASTIATPGANGTLDVLNGGTVNITNSGINVATNQSVVGSVLVSGGGALIEFTGTATGMNIGNLGQGMFDVESGGTLLMDTTHGISVGASIGSTGTFIVAGTGALVSFGTVARGISVGQSGSGTLDIESGGSIVMNGTSGISVGQSAGSNGLLIVNGAAAALNEGTTATGLFVGQGGPGTLQVSNGGSVTIGFGGLLVGNFGSGGTVSVSGSGSEITTLGTTGLINVGNGGGGTLSINGGTVVASSNIFVAAGGASSGSGNIQVTGGRLAANGFSVGQAGQGTLSVGGGGIVSNTGTRSFNIGFSPSSSGTVVVAGGTLANTTGFFAVGGTNASGTLLVDVGGLLNTGGVGILTDINATGTGHAGAAVGGGVWNVGGQLVIGDDGVGSLDINGNGFVNDGTNQTNIGNKSGGSGTVSVNIGTLATGLLFVGATIGSSGHLTIDNGGIVAAGTATIGSGGQLNMNGGVLNATAPVQLSGMISGFGTVGAGIANGGTVAVNVSRLLVSGNITGAGFDSIAGTTTLEVGGTVGVGQSVGFAGPTAALQLDNLASATQGFVLSNWQNTDDLIIGNGSTVTGANWLSGSSPTGTLEVDTTGGTIDFTSVTLAPGAFPIFNTGSNSVELVSCFAAGTRIATPDREVAVEALQVGDRVVLASGELERVVWIGYRTIDCARHPRPQQVWPVRISAGAFGSLPRRDLFLSPDHAVLIDDVLVPVKHLIDGEAVAQVQVDSVTYYHVELTRHAVLLAEGLPAESYLDVGDRAHFANGGAVVTLHPDLACRVWEAAACAPLVVAGPQLDRVKRRLRAA